MGCGKCTVLKKQPKIAYKTLSKLDKLLSETNIITWTRDSRRKDNKAKIVLSQSACIEALIRHSNIQTCFDTGPVRAVPVLRFTRLYLQFSLG